MNLRSTENCTTGNNGVKDILGPWKRNRSRKGDRKVFEEIITENFPNLVETISPSKNLKEPQEEET